MLLGSQEKVPNLWSTLYTFEHGEVRWPQFALRELAVGTVTSAR